MKSSWFALLFVCVPVVVGAVVPVPDKLVVLTFDDSVVSHYEVARPLLKKFGFGATFFISEGFDFLTNKKAYLTWEQIAELHRDGFEIGNHTRDHMKVTPENLPKLRQQIAFVARHCEENGIPAPVTFAYPGNGIEPGALGILEEMGIRLARRGGAPEFRYQEGRGRAYLPGVDHPLLIPSAGDSRPSWTLNEFKLAVGQARDGRIAVIQFHGVPDTEHPWVNTPAERFAEYLQYLKDNDFQVVALRDILKYVDPDKRPADPFADIQRATAEAE